jgi:hypothetical protein
MAAVVIGALAAEVVEVVVVGEVELLEQPASTAAGTATAAATISHARSVRAR